jgi:hypothetical protein
MLYCSELKEREVDVEENRKMRNDGKCKMRKINENEEDETGNKESKREKRLKFNVKPKSIVF